MTNTQSKEIDGNEIKDSMKLISESKAHLLTFINGCGFHLDHREYKRVDFLVKTRSDVNTWVKLFVEVKNNIDMICEITDKFKAKKIKIMNIGFDDFITSSLISLKGGLEEFFQVECSNDELNKINQKIHNGELSLEFIYQRGKGDYWYNSVGKFARTDWTRKLIA